MNGADIPPPSLDTIRAFEQALLDSSKVRLFRDELWQLWNTADAAWAGTGAARPRLIHALGHLDDEGVIELPSRNGNLWDQGLLSLPDRLSVPANRKNSSALLDPAHEPWCPTLDWAPAWIRNTRPPQQLRMAAVAINRWLLSTTGRLPARVAREERSLHIFGDEKRLAHLAQGPLFAAGRLTLDHLVCDAPLGSLRIARLSAAGPVLILENKSTFDSAWRALRTAANPGYAAVVFGGGDSVTSLIDDLTHLHDLQQIHATVFYYAGDVDIAGIEAATHFAQAAQQARLPAAMALPLWDAVGQAEPTGDDLTAPLVRKAPALRSAHNLGLPESVGDRLHAGVRVPQERVDRTKLSEQHWWRPD